MYKTTGERLRALRLNKGKTLESAAKEIGITPSALGNYENNFRIPRDEVKIKIAKYYNVSIEYLFFYSTTTRYE